MHPAVKGRGLLCIYIYIYTCMHPAPRGLKLVDRVLLFATPSESTRKFTHGTSFSRVHVAQGLRNTAILLGIRGPE